MSSSKVAGGVRVQEWSRGTVQENSQMGRNAGWVALAVSIGRCEHDIDQPVSVEVARGQCNWLVEAERRGDNVPERSITVAGQQGEAVEGAGGDSGAWRHYQI